MGDEGVTPEISGRKFCAVYGAAHLGKSLTWYSSELLFAFFLTEVCGLTGGQMALALAGSLVVNAALDVLVGALLVRRVRTLWQACRLQALGAALSGGALVLFAFVGLIPASDRFGYSTAAMLFFRLAYVVYDSPQNAVLGLVTAGSAERLNLISIRFVFSAVATLVVSALAAPLLIGGNRSDHAIGFAIYAAVLALVGLASGLALAMIAPRKSVSGAAPGTAPAVGGAHHFLPSLGIANLLILIFVVAAGGSTFSRLEPYFAAVALPDTATRSALLVAIAFAGLVGQPLWLGLTGRYGWKKAMSAAAVSTTAAALAFFLFAAHGPVSSIGLGFVFGVSACGLNLLLWSALTETVAQGRTRLAPPLAFGILVAVIKLSGALSVVGVGAVLSRVHQIIGPALGTDYLGPMTAISILGGLLCLFALRLSKPS